MIVDNWSMQGVLYTQYLGIVQGRQLIDYALAVSGDERFENLRYIVGDWSQVEHTEISTDDVKELVACLKVMARLCPHAANASIVKRNESGLALAAWYQHLSDNISWKVATYHSPEECFQAYKLNFFELESARAEQRCDSAAEKRSQI